VSEKERERDRHEIGTRAATMKQAERYAGKQVIKTRRETAEKSAKRQGKR
jgi:hypothetical protein